MERSEIRDYPIRSPKPWLVARHAEGMAQGGDAVDENGGTSIGDGDREEERPTGNEASPIVHHARSLPRITLRSIRATPRSGPPGSFAALRRGGRCPTSSRRPARYGGATFRSRTADMRGDSPRACGEAIAITRGPR